MKQLFLFVLLFIALSNNVVSGSTIAGASPSAPEGIIIVDTGGGLITVDAYMSARYVKVEVLDASNNVQSSIITGTGSTVSFSINSNSARVRSTYYMQTQSYIIDDVIMI